MRQFRTDILQKLACRIRHWLKGNFEKLFTDQKGRSKHSTYGDGKDARYAGVGGFDNSEGCLRLSDNYFVTGTGFEPILGINYL